MYEKITTDILSDAIAHGIWRSGEQSRPKRQLENATSLRSSSDKRVKVDPGKASHN